MAKTGSRKSPRRAAVTKGRRSGPARGATGERTLTAKSAKKAYPAGTSLRLTHPKVQGLGLLILPSGQRRFTLRYASPTLRDSQGRGRRRELTIGEFPAMSLSEAIGRTRAHKRDISDGIDPMERRDERRREPTWEDLAELYMEQHAPTKADAPKDAGRLRNYILPAWGRMKVSAVGKSEIRKLHREISREYPGAADKVLAQVSKMINFAQEWDMLPLGRNPVSLVRRNGQQSHGRYLDERETAALLDAVDAVEQRWGPGGHHPPGAIANWRRWAHEQATAVRVIVFSGLRHSQVLRLRWSDLDRERRRLHIAKRKAKKTKRQDTWIPVDNYVFELLDTLSKPDIGDHWCFPSPHGKGHRDSLRGFWQKVLDEADIGRLRIHDLRHTYASHSLSSGATLDEVQRLLGHVSRASTEVYADLMPEAGAEAASRTVQRLRKTIKRQR